MTFVASTDGDDPDRTPRACAGLPTPRVAEPPSKGSVLAGKYRLDKLLAEGGMAYVWSAYNLELQLPVAIKLLRAAAPTERLPERLRREACAAARLVHPSIVRIFDVALTDAGEPFIVMELLEGETLAQLLARGRLSAVGAVQLLLPIAEALALSHDKGVVHRDLKPANVFVSGKGRELQPKLLDFGIAKLVHTSALVPKLTDKGLLLGSPNYMSPEQVRGEQIDQRSDVWSFCVLLYKAVTGVVPFRSAKQLGVLEAIMNAEPYAPPPEADVDAKLWQLIHWGLAKDPAQRPPTMRALGRSLARWLVERGATEDCCGSPLVTKWLRVRASRLERLLPARPRYWAPLAALALLMVGGTVAIAEPPRSSPSRAAPAQARVLAAASPARLPAAAVATPPDLELHAAVSPAAGSTAAVASTAAVVRPASTARRGVANPSASAARATRAPSSQLPF